MTPTRNLLLPLLAALLAHDAAAGERPYIDISGATFRPYPLAITRATLGEGVDPAVAEQLAQRVRFDLEVSGLFQVLDPRSFLAAPDEGMTTLSIKFGDWANVGAEGLLKGTLSMKDGEVVLRSRLFNVTTAQESAQWTHTTRPEGLRRLAHRLANAVVEHFTQEPGTFETRITFVRRVKGDKHVWVSDWDGHGATRIAWGELNLLPSWHPTGKLVAFTSYRAGDPSLFSVTMSGKVKKLIGGGAMYTGAAYSPDGSKVAYTRTRDGNAEIYVADADGSRPRRLTDSYGVDTSPCWSPDGRRIAFVSSRHGNPHIFVMDANGSNQKRVTFQGNYNQTPDWSPRGDVIAFTARDERNVFDLFTVNPDTREILRLTQDTGNNEEPSFSPNGRHIVFVSTRKGRSQLWLMNADGTNQRALALPEGSYFTPAWGPWPSTSEGQPTRVP